MDPRTRRSSSPSSGEQRFWDVMLYAMVAVVIVTVAFLFWQLVD